MESCMIPYLAGVPMLYIKAEKEVVQEKPEPFDKYTGPYKSMYELTLTTDKDDPYELRQWLTKIVKSAMFKVVAFRACIELTKKGMPHIHAILYSSETFLDASKIKALKYPYRYELEKVHSYDKFFEYIKKEKNNVSMNMYCERKGIPQFWHGTKAEGF